MIGYYTLFTAADAIDDEAVKTMPHMVPVGNRRHKIGGFSNPKTRSTTWTFTHRRDRDQARIWLLKWADQKGLNANGII